MSTFRYLTLSLLLVPALAGCPKKIDLSLEAGAVDAAAAAAPADAAVAAADAAAPLDAAAPVATHTAPAGCAAGSAMMVVDGKKTCEVECNMTKGTKDECNLPQICIGKAMLANAEAGAPLTMYCRTPPSGACPNPNSAQFYSTSAHAVCETLCSKDNDPVCPTGTKCTGEGQLMAVDSKMAQPHRYCKKQ
jgi:hypothetical protein